MNLKIGSASTVKSSAGTGKYSRYQGLIGSVIAFLVLIGMLMFSSIWISSKVAANTEEQLVTENLRDSLQTIMQNLFNLKLSYGEDPNSPHIQHSLTLLKNSKQRLDKDLNALIQGGEAEIHNNETVVISGLTKEGNDERLKQFKAGWDPLSKQIDVYLGEATSPTADSANLDLAVMSAQNINEKMQENINGVLTVLNTKIADRTALLRWIQIGGIAILIAYFLIFVLLFLRKLLDSDTKAEAARNETSEIMNTVSTGLFLLDKDLNIGSQYSKELERLIGQNDLSGRNLLEVLGDMISQESLNTTRSFVEQLYNPRVKERLIGSLNPLSRQEMTVLQGATEVVRYLDFKFNRVYSGSDISRILVNVSDVTDAVLLEKKIAEEREQNDLQLEMLSTILRADRQMIDDFVRNTQKHNITINNTLKSPGERPNELRNKIELIFREAHSLKGEAYALNLHGFTVIAENIESELKKLQAQSSLSGENFLGLAVHLEELMNLTQTIEDLVSRLGASDPDILPNAQGQNASSDKMRTADYYARLVADVAERNGKMADFTYVGVNQVPDENLRTIMHEVAVQLLRNAVVHGIERPIERQAKRKLEAGHVRMSLQETESTYVLSFEDDGNGIDYDAIRAKAVNMGRYSAEQAEKLGTKELLMLMFSSGFSTVDTATADAGRGVGLDVIKDRVNAVGGRINISTSAGAYTRFIFTFPKTA